MLKTLRTTLLPPLLLAGALRGQAQELLPDGSLKLQAVATDPQYGYVADYAHSIKVGNPDNAIYYMMALRGPHGEKVSFRRIGSCCPYALASGPNGVGLLARWEATYAGLAQPITLYLNKNEYQEPLCPAGFTFKTVQDAPPPVLFPADSIRPARLCAGPSCAVDDPLLKGRLPAALPLPDQNPAFPGGPEAVKSYFAQHPLQDAEARKLVFRVSVSFQVSCKGEAGNYQLLSQGRGELATYANQVLAIVNRMPPTWQPALQGGLPVNCYQVLSFTVLGGSLERVAYR